MSRKILEKIVKDFSRDELAFFFRSKSPKFEQKMEPLRGYDGDKFDKFTVIGEIELKNRFKLAVVAVEKNDGLTERTSRKAQFDLAKKIMQERFAFHAAAIFVFHDKKGLFRFSLIHRQYKGTKAEFGPFRRFTYFVSPQESNRTFLNRIGEAPFDSLDEIRDAFSVEKVNKEFYQEIEALFHRFVSDDQVMYPDLSDDRKETKEFAVRLLGRIIFCWFLKKKRSSTGIALLPDALLASKIVDSYTEYYHDVLEPLFFEVLNAPTNDRDPRSLLQIGQFADTIPFLNGGLFDPEPGDKYIAGMNGVPSQSSRNIIVVPNKWFSDLFALLERFNFTLDENTPVDVELSIDPEMLGRIFENLLAEINPETGNTARNATGSFYTPRAIVEYMVNQSLKRYLVQAASVTEETADCLLSYHSEINCVPDEKARLRIIEALDRLKVLDPACGSGAFPMGMLQKMLLILDRIDPGAERWLDRMLTRVPSQFKAMVRCNLKKEGPEYVHKMGLIQEVIYGTDNQTIAVELSRLRVFLSLIIEARVDDAAENRGIHPLPNLDFKFVCADTLIRLNNLQTGATDMAPQVQDLKDLRELYFTAYGKDKEQYKEEFTQKQAELFKFVTAWVKDSSDTKLIAEWSPFKSAPAPFFDPEWMFGVKDGFDIVIGNPPYIQLQSNHGALAEKYAGQNYLSFARTGDIYALFYERGAELLKEGGHLCYITSNKWMRAKYGEKLRDFFSSRTEPVILMDFGGYAVFDSATVDTNILLFMKTKTNKDKENRERKAKACKIEKDFNTMIDLADYVEKNSFTLSGLSSESWIISSGDESIIRKRIETLGTPLREWNVQINYGIKTGFNEAFIIDGKTKNRLIKEDPKSAEIIKPLLRGRDIKKYRIEFADQWLINAHNGYASVGAPLVGSQNQKQPQGIVPTINQIPPVDINNYSAVKKHLDQYREEIFKRYDKGDTPYNLRNCAYVEDFEKEKIIYPDIMRLPRDAINHDDYPYFYLDTQGYYAEATNFILTGKSLHIIAAVLASRLGVYSFVKFYTGPQFDEKGFRYKKEYLQNMPIPKAEKERADVFKNLIYYIQHLKVVDQPLMASFFETIIDNMVYDLYFEDLTRARDIHISEIIEKLARPFKENMTDAQKLAHCEKLYHDLKNNNVVMRAIINRKNIDFIKVIEGTADGKN
ncbi:MAG TPA: Eco57I restriction-modification methylase domain-containing protein [bacterium]|nr:Eco57I restriction-modification methylase domain-containing protein [bacterium]